MDRRNALKVLSAPSLCLGSRSAFSQADKPIRIVSPYAPGGIVDGMARLVAKSMSATLQRPVVIDTRPGAGGLIGVKAVQTASPDGDTLLMTTSALASIPLLQANANYSATKDFAPVAMVGVSPDFLMVHRSVPAQNIPEFLAWAKTQPQGVECADNGPATVGYLISALFAKLADIKLLHVSYKGTGEIARALTVGEVKMQMSTTSDAINAQVKQGNIKILGAASAKPSPLAPGVPTINDTLPGFSIDGWHGIVAPAGTPAARIAVLSDAVRIALMDPDVKKTFASMYVEAHYRNPQEFAVAISDMTAVWQRIVKELNLWPQ